MDSVTRIEIADLLESEFDGSRLPGPELLDRAANNGARQEVLAVLSRLHGSTYRGLPDLWEELADVPVEA